MDELSQYLFEPLWAEGEFVLSRSVRDAALAPLPEQGLPIHGFTFRPDCEQFQPRGSIVRVGLPRRRLPT